MQPINNQQALVVAPQPDLQANKPNYLSSVSAFTGSGYPFLADREIFVKAKLGTKMITALGEKGTPLTPKLMRILILGVMDDLSCAIDVSFDDFIDTMFNEESHLKRIIFAIIKIASCPDHHPLCFYGASVLSEAYRANQILNDGRQRLTQHKAEELKGYVKIILNAAGQMRVNALLDYAANLIFQNE